MKECEVTDLFNSLKEQPGGCVLIDVREYPEYAGGRVAEAKLIPLGAIEKRHNEIDRDAAVFLICRSGRRSAEAQVKLSALGFPDVRNVRGGFEAWQAAGLPVERDPGAVWSLERQVRFAAGSLVFLGVLLAIFVHSYFIALPAFIGAGLVFAAVTDTCGMAMALAKMPWNKGSGAVCDAAPRRA
jgi:rhodanese-related sulfurtransferase